MVTKPGNVVDVIVMVLPSGSEISITYELVYPVAFTCID